MPNKIKSAAIIYRGVIYDGKNHASIGLHMIANKICDIPFPNRENQGFVTEDGIFLDRKQAMIVALENNQVNKEKIGNRKELFSEDLI